MAFPTSVTDVPDTTSSETLATAGGIGLSAYLDILGVDIEAIETKMGTGSSTPTLNKVLTGSGTGTSAWSSTLAGLTLTAPIISSISNTGTLTLPTSTDTLVGRATTDALSNKTITLSAGTTGVAPLTYTSGTNLTTASAGATEYDGKAFYATPNASNRGVVPTTHITTATADFTGTNVNTAQPVFDTAADTITLPASTSYIMRGVYHIHTTGTTSHQLGLLFAGTATLTSIAYSASATNAATEVTGAPSTLWVTVATVTNVTPGTATATHHTVIIEGIVRTNGAGTFIPQYQWSAAPGVAGVTLKGSYLSLTPFGSDTAVSVGNWS